MGFALLPLAMLLLGLGVQIELQHMALSVHGAGAIGQMDSIARVQAQQLEVFDVACNAAALAVPGVVSQSLPVTMGSGVSTPASAVCMTTTGGGGSRNVYSYMPGVPGEAGQIVSDTNSSAAWYRVQASGQAFNLVTGQLAAMPAAIPVGAIVGSINVNP